MKTKVRIALGALMAIALLVVTLPVPQGSSAQERRKAKAAEGVRLQET